MDVTVKESKTLSDVPSEAIQQSLDDMQTCQDNGWTINMGTWVDTEECEVCQAGAIMLTRYGYMSRNDFGDREALLKARVLGFNNLRFLDINFFLAEGFRIKVSDDVAEKIQKEVDASGLEPGKTMWYQDPAYFKHAMQTVIDILKTHNL